MTELYGAIGPIVEYLRGDDVQETVVAPMMECMERAYQKTRQGILLAMDQQVP